MEIRKEKEEFHQWKKTLQCHTLFFDGASKGNLGKFGTGGLIFYLGGKLETSFNWGVGHLTNNQAKFFALLKACQLATKEGHNNLQIFGDFEISIKILNSNSLFNNHSLNVIMQRLHFIL